MLKEAVANLGSLAGYVCFDAADPAAVTAALGQGSEFFRNRLTDARRQRLVAETRTGRAGTTADIAAPVMFLASPAAGHVTGQVIHVNGGAYLGG